MAFEDSTLAIQAIGLLENMRHNLRHNGPDWKKQVENVKVADRLPLSGPEPSALYSYNRSGHNMLRLLGDLERVSTGVNRGRLVSGLARFQITGNDLDDAIAELKPVATRCRDLSTLDDMAALDAEIAFADANVTFHERIW